MRKKIAIALTAGVAAATMGFGATGTASAAPNAKGACVQAGLGTLESLNKLQAAAQNPGKQGLDYSTLANSETGPIYANLDPETYFSLGQVVKLHTTSPTLFQWCGGGPAE